MSGFLERETISCVKQRLEALGVPAPDELTVEIMRNETTSEPVLCIALRYGSETMTTAVPLGPGRLSPLERMWITAEKAVLRAKELVPA